MDFGLLGEFRASHDGQPVAVGRRHERLTLALLLLAGGEVVTTTRLLAAIWPDPPAAARGTLHTYIGRLRRTLRPFGVQIVRSGDGYLVETAGHSTDVGRFRELSAAGAAATDPVERIRAYDEALSLWRGPVLGDLGDAELIERFAGALTRQRLATAETGAQLRLEMGEPEPVITGLLALAEAEPTQERLIALVMTALYRCGRRAEALRLFDRAAVALGELGVDPGEPLLALCEQIRQADPELLRPAAPVYAVRVRGEWLPWNTSGHPALEFCNTYAGWGRPERIPGSEWLRSYSTLAVWAGHVGLIDDWDVTRLLREARRDPAGAEKVRLVARELRAQLYACLTEDQPSGFKAVAAVAERAAKLSVFERGEDGLGRWQVSPSAGLRLPIYAVAQNAALLLADARRFTVQVCPGPDCGWLFLDAGARRRWCSLGTCGAGAEGC
jgi:DNA-binding SARP family transcriptional activator/predicted RNA-binding Zn ribbon-like protein